MFTHYVLLVCEQQSIEKSIHTTTMSFGHHIITATNWWVFALSSNTFKMFTAEIDIHFLKV